MPPCVKHHHFASLAIIRISALAVVIFTSWAALSSEALAQPREEHAIDINGGYGLSFPYDDSDESGNGLIGGAEYGFASSAWAGLRAYGTLIWTWPADRDDACDLLELPCRVTANALMLGAKGRLAIPIPYVAPFIELGLGASLGSLRTQTQYRQKEIDGISLHIPFALGFAIGPEHDVDIALVIYFHPAAKQANGGYSLGFSIPLDSSGP